MDEFQQKQFSFIINFSRKFSSLFILVLSLNFQSGKTQFSSVKNRSKTNSGRLLGSCRQISLQSCSVTGTTATARRCRSNGYDSYPLNQGKSLQPLMTVNYKGNRVITHQQSCQFDPRNFIFHIFHFPFYDLFLQITYFIKTQ